jgi:hypothetical protein
VIDIFALAHTSTHNCLDMKIFKDKFVNIKTIACGFTKPEKYDLSEVSDFYPSYASLNSSIFESSVILTIWEHMKYLCKGSHIGIVHTDIIPFYKKAELWTKIKSELASPRCTLGISFPMEYSEAQVGVWELKNEYVLRPSVDPMLHNRFDPERSIWDIIKRIDPKIYHFAISKDPTMLYSHMFFTSIDNFNKLGFKLKNALEKLSAIELGLWTPHLFERLVGLYLSEISDVKNVCAFKHFAGSSPLKPSTFALYGTRNFKYFKNSRKIFAEI